MFQVLLIEDSEECKLLVQRALANPEIKLTWAKTIQEAHDFLHQTLDKTFDLILLDLSLPDGDGLTFMEKLYMRESFRGIPVYFLTNSGDLSQKVSAFGLGAEDYLVKPVNPIELKARVEMRLHKNALKGTTSQIIKKGPLILDTLLMKTLIESKSNFQSIDLTAKEFKILAFLAKNEGRAFSRAELVKAVWGSTVHVLDRTVDSHIYGLRKKLRNVSHYIECIPHLGYRFISTPERRHYSNQTL